MRKLLGVMAALLSLSLAPAAYAWSPRGNEQIADIAWTRLTPRAKAEITAILAAGDPQFQPRSSGESDVRAAFRKAATFPDYIQSHDDPGYRLTIYEGMIDRLNETWQPDADRNVSPADRVRCKTWHSYDTPIHVTGERPVVAQSNALNALQLANHELARLQLSTEADRRTVQAFWLYWVTNLVGDLHQPLRCAESFQLFRDGDDGGSRFRIKDPLEPQREMRLRTYWDSGIERATAMGAGDRLSTRIEQVTARWSADAQLLPSEAVAADVNVPGWIATGAQIAERRAYAGIEPGSVPSEEYATAHSDISKRQAVLAGFRLANVLNRLLGEGDPSAVVRMPIRRASGQLRR